MCASTSVCRQVNFARTKQLVITLLSSFLPSFISNQPLVALNSIFLNLANSPLFDVLTAPSQMR